MAAAPSHCEAERPSVVAVAALRVAADNVSTSKLDPELRVGDLAAPEIAVHILATSKTKSGRAGGADYDYVEERLLAGARTWGRGFPRLSYIVGSSDDLDDMSARLGAAVTVQSGTSTTSDVSRTHSRMMT